MEMKLDFNFILAPRSSWPLLARRVAATLVPLLGAAAPAQAGSDIFFVTYTHEIEHGETEVMLMTDLTRPAERSDSMGTYASQMLELEHGITRQWAAELMLEGYYDATHGAGRFTGFRVETRYRLFPEKNRGVNPTLYVECEHLHPATRYKMELSGREDGVGEPQAVNENAWERILETRLVLSRDLGPYNVAFNWINETDLRGGASGFTDFGYAVGVRRALGEHVHGGHEPEAQGGDGAEKAGGWKPAAVGLEVYGGLGNSRAFGGPFRAQQHYLQPVVAFHPGRTLMIHIGLAVGLTGPSDLLLRTAVSLGF